MLPQSVLSELSRGICLEGIEYNLRRTERGHHCMNMICSHVECQQRPLSNPTGLTNRLFNCLSMAGLEDQRLNFQLLLIVTMPAFVWRNVGRTVSIVKAIDRTAFVAVQPSTVRTERNEVSKRSVSVVPHDEDEEATTKVARYWQSCLGLSMYSRGHERDDEVTLTLPRDGTDSIGPGARDGQQGPDATA
jgi:hypothetical protein